MLEGKGSFVPKLRGTWMCARRERDFYTPNIERDLELEGKGIFCTQNVDRDLC